MVCFTDLFNFTILFSEAIINQWKLNWKWATKIEKVKRFIPPNRPPNLLTPLITLFLLPMYRSRGHVGRRTKVPRSSLRVSGPVVEGLDCRPRGPWFNPRSEHSKDSSVSQTESAGHAFPVERIKTNFLKVILKDNKGYCPSNTSSQFSTS